MVFLQPFAEKTLVFHGVLHDLLHDPVLDEYIALADVVTMSANNWYPCTAVDR